MDENVNGYVDADVDVYEGDYGEGESPDEPKFTATMGYGSG